MKIAEEYASVLMQAWSGKLEFPKLIEIAGHLESAGFRPLVAVLYQTWLKRSQSPYVHAVWFNLGATLTNEGDFPGAEAAYRQAIALAPLFVHPRVNLGLLLERLGQVDQAIDEWKWVDQNIPVGAPENKAIVLVAINHLGRVMEGRRQYGEAIDYLQKSLAIEPNQPDVLHHLIFLREKICAWPIYREIKGVSPDFMRQSTSALAMLSLSDDPAEQLAAARRYVEKSVRSDVLPLANPKGYGHSKIRIAYLSSDFCLHPVSMLTVQLIELHNREKFEVYGYCWSPEDGSTMRKRVIDAMDHFSRIGAMTDEAAAKLIREHEIDILIDLQGQTAGARANLLAHRPAPIQITYLGLPATTGLPSIDYVIADRFLIPEKYAEFYSERPLYMPDVYQVSDRKRDVASVPTRASCGLPDSGFVFCSLNNNNKYTPEIFDVWMRILQRVPDSVLWLLADNPWAEANLRQEAALKGVGKDRLIFASRVSPENYLARFPIADLFLDTFPFNAGTTANDALWQGLPVLTLSGKTFASRMAGALLTAAHLPELITTTPAEYEEKAVWLANNPEECSKMRKQLAVEHEQGVLFDSSLFVRNLESRLEVMMTEL